MSLELVSPGQDVSWEPKLFDPLAAADIMAATRQGGRNLELAQAWALARALGGRLEGRTDGSGDAVVTVAIPTG